MAEAEGDFPRSEKIHHRYIEEIWIVGLHSIATPIDTNLKKLIDFASDSNLINPTMYYQLIGALMYLTNTRPDICFVVNALSQFMCEPRKIHWTAAKHVLRYLCGTVGYDL